MRKSLMALGVLVVAVAACGDGGEDDTSATATSTTEAAAQADHEIVIEEFTYSPAQLKVERGQTVRFVNRDAFEHTVTSGETSGAENVPDGKFDESLPDKDATAVITFDDAGTFTFYCRQHNAMDGEITVS